MHLGFIGLGMIGNPAVRRLLAKGYSVAVHDLRREASANLLGLGATWAQSPREVCHGATVVFTSLPTPQDVEQVTLAEDGLVAGLTPGTVFVDLTTNAPATVVRLCSALQDRGLTMLDAPVSGGSRLAKGQALSAIMVGGQKEVFLAVKPILEALADNIFYCGPIGSGSVCKLANNLITQAGAVLVSEALTLAVKAGVELKTVYEIISVSSGQTRTMSYFPDKFFKGDFISGFALRLAAKDVRLAVELARQVGVPMPMAALADQQFTEALGKGWGHMDCSAVLQLQEQRAGVQLRLHAG